MCLYKADKKTQSHIRSESEKRSDRDTIMVVGYIRRCYTAIWMHHVETDWTDISTAKVNGCYILKKIKMIADYVYVFSRCAYKTLLLISAGLARLGFSFSSFVNGWWTILLVKVYTCCKNIRRLLDFYKRVAGFESKREKKVTFSMPEESQKSRTQISTRRFFYKTSKTASTWIVESRYKFFFAASSKLFRCQLCM